MYEFLDAALLRAPTGRPESPAIAWPDLSSPGTWFSWLEAAWQTPGFAPAVEAASPSLARQVDKILSHHDVPAATVRRAVVSTLRYLLRAQSRATPFGLLAGVAPVHIREAAITKAGGQHRTVTRPDAAWLHEQVTGLETDSVLLPRLSVTANNLVVRQHQNLVLAHRANAAPDGAPERVQIRATPPALAALDTAAQPILVADLAGQLAERFPAVPGAVIDGLITRLAGQGFLLTNLRPAVTEPDPLAAVLRVLDVIPLPDGSGAAQQRARLHAVQAVVTGHDAASHPTAARECRTLAAGLMGTLTPFATDLRLDWDLAIPRTVADEAAHAAGVLARLARRPALSAGWADWHARFLDRYGPSALVPVLDAVDLGTGLGYPAGYLDSPYAVPPSPVTDRDRLLLQLAQRAAVRGDTEVIFDDAMISRLSVIGAGTPLQPSAEITVRVHAASVRDLNDGQFELHVTGASRGAGTTAGRFLHLLDDHDRERVAGLYAAPPGALSDTMTAQLSAAPLHARTGNVARSPRIGVSVISLGEYHAPGGDQLPLADLGVTGDATRLALVSLSRKRPVHPVLVNAVDLARHSHPLTRFLAEAPVALSAPCTGFEWGAAHALPFLPALRYRRTLLSPARWNLTDDDLPGPAGSAQAWDAAFAAWQQRAGVPAWVYLGDGDQCLRLHLAEPSHRALLREQLRKGSKATLRTAPAPRDLGWADGRVHEIAIPVRATQHGAPMRIPGEITGRRHGYLPGRDGRLYLKLHASRDQQDAILTGHLPGLRQRLGAQLTCCWFIRYDHPGEHLRLRLTFDPHALARIIEQADTWTETLRNEELLNSMSWETYYPETARFGGPAAMEAAEAYFTADSSAAIAQLAACTGKHGPDVRALTAASLVDLADAMIGDEAGAMRWLAEHTAADTIPPPRPLFKEAVALAATRDVDPEVATAWAQRRAALTAYRDVLRRAGAADPVDLLPDLLHLHHARVSGPDLAAERACLHLARAAALSQIARTRRMQPA